MPIRVAAVVIPAIIVMDEAAGALRDGTTCHRQTGRLIGQESGTTEILNRLASMGTFADLDTVIFFACGLRGNGRCMHFFLPANPVPSERNGRQQQDKHKYLNHFNAP